MIEAMHLAGVILLSIATLLPLSRSTAWWIRGLDFPRLQLFLFAIVLVIFQLQFSDYGDWLNYGLLFLTGLILMYQFSWIYPYTPLAPLEVKWCDFDCKEETLGILCANVLTPNRDAEALKRIVESCEPDLLVTLESDLWWQEKLASIEETYTNSIKWPLDNLFGMHLYSRLPLHDAQVEYLVEDGIPSIHCKVEMPSGRRIQCHFLHPTPPVPEFNEESTERDAELIVVAKSVRESKDPIIVAGDLNDVAWSTTTRLFRKISGLLDPRVGRGLFNTFNAHHWYMRWPLDHLFHSAHFKVHKIQRMPAFGSDHFALFTKLTLDESPDDDAEAISAKPADQELAEEKIREGNASEESVPN